MRTSGTGVDCDIYAEMKVLVVHRNAPLSETGWPGVSWRRAGRIGGPRLADQAAGLEGAVPDFALLDSLPVANVNLARLPDAQGRGLFDAFRLEVRYNRAANVAHCQVTVSAETRLDPVTFCVVPPGR